MPSPLGNFCKFETGKGFQISKILNKIKPDKINLKFIGMESMVTRNPAISSIMILGLSCSLNIVSARVDISIPNMINSVVKII